MSKKDRRLSRPIDIQHAGQMVDAFSLSCGAPCTLLDENGDVLLPPDPDSCILCGQCQSLLCPGQQCRDLHTYGGRQAERFGGRYIYFCTMGMGWIAAPILLGGKVVGSLSCGPIMIMDLDDYIASTPSLQDDMSLERLEHISRLLRRFPRRDPEDLNYISLQLLASALYIGDSSMAVIERRNQAEQYQSIGQYLQQYKLKDTPTTYPIDKEQELVKAISEGDERDARRLLNEILGYIFFAAGGEYQAMRVRSLELMSVLSRAAISGGADQAHVLALNQQFLEESDRLHSTEDLVGWLTRLITRYAGLVFEQADVKHKDILYDAINYMKQHLAERVTLEETARQVGFSPNYFSKVFKEEMGCTFSHYLSKLRIDRSKALLLVSKLSIREICDAVGYEEQSYFIKVFTRFTGVTPGKFRKRGGRLDSSKERDTTVQ